MSDLFKKLGIEFDGRNETTLSKAKLLSILQRSGQQDVFSVLDLLPQDYYLLVDYAFKDFYPVPLDHLKEWEGDGSCESGDLLFKMTFIKKY